MKGLSTHYSKFCQPGRPSETLKKRGYWGSSREGACFPGTCAVLGLTLSTTRGNDTELAFLRIRCSDCSSRTPSVSFNLCTVCSTPRTRSASCRWGTHPASSGEGHSCIHFNLCFLPDQNICFGRATGRFPEKLPSAVGKFWRFLSFTLQRQFREDWPWTLCFQFPRLLGHFAGDQQLFFT